MRLKPKNLTVKKEVDENPPQAEAESERRKKRE